MQDFNLPEAFNKTRGEKSDYITGHEVFYILQQLDGGTGEVLKEMDISEEATNFLPCIFMV